MVEFAVDRAAPPVCDAVQVSSHRIRFEGPAEIAVGVATTLADQPGVDLVGSEPLTFLDGQVVRLDITATGSDEDVAGAVERIAADLPATASLTERPG